MHRSPRWMPLWPEEPDQREKEILQVIAAGYSSRTAYYWYFLKKLGPSAEYDIPPNGEDAIRRRI